MSDAEAPTLPIAAAAGDAAEEATYGRFVARGMLGRGGMGVVLRAYDPELDREVALKLLHPGAWEATERSIGVQQVRAEGQALAKLAHPNVVTVYEIGRVGESAFIAMELVEGKTLRRWLDEPRPVRAVVGMFAACGRGLAAAHAAGLVHRDFKPDNVLIGADGRPRVTDFGLVTRGVAGDGGEVDAHGELRVEGAVVGTPAYMAPEQWRGGAVDARTDQFAFCVALWEALAGAHPFGGEDADARRAAVLAGRVVAPRRAMPRAIEAALRRGMEVERSARWPAMAPLLDALERAVRPATARWIAVAAVAIVAVGVAAVALAMRERGHDRVDACEVAARKIDAAWSGDVRARVVETLRRGAAAHDRTAAEVEAALDGYVSRWRAVAREACREASPQGSALRDAQAACVDRARLSFAAVTAALAADAGANGDAAGAGGDAAGADGDAAGANGDAAGADREAAAGAVARLPELAACTDLERLATVAPPPADAGLRRRLDAVRAQLASVAGHRAVGDQAAARGAAQAAAMEARAIGHAPTLADALQILGDAELDRGDLVAAERTFRESAIAAAEGRDDHATAYAWTRVLYIVAERREQPEGAAALLPVADAALRRAGDPRMVRFMFENAAGTLAARRGDLAEAKARFTAAMAAAGNARERAQAQGNLGNAIWEADGPAAALPTLREAAAGMEEVRGGEHPDTADALYRLGACTNAAGDAAGARAPLERALVIQERAFGARSFTVALTLEALGNVTSNLRDHEASLAYFDRAIAIERAVAAPPAATAMTMAARVIMLMDHRPELARTEFPAVIDAMTAAAGEASFEAIMTRASYAELLQRLGRCDEAVAVLDALAPAAEMAEAHAYIAETRAKCGARGQSRGRATR